MQVAAVLLACVLQAVLLSAHPPHDDDIHHDQHDLRAAEIDMAPAEVDRANSMAAEGVALDRSDVVAVCGDQCNHLRGGDWEAERRWKDCVNSCKHRSRCCKILEERAPFCYNTCLG